jgi:hypothetical protein
MQDEAVITRMWKSLGWRYSRYTSGDTGKEYILLEKRNVYEDARDSYAKIIKIDIKNKNYTAYEDFMCGCERRITLTFKENEVLSATIRFLNE